MKKILTLFFFSVFMFLCTGCSDEKADASLQSVENVYDFQKYDTFIENLTSLASQSPEFTITQFNEILLEDGRTAYTYFLTEEVSEETLRLSINTDTEDNVIFVNLSTERDYFQNLPFAVASHYIYKAMGFQETNSENFFEDFDLFSKEEIFETKTIGDYQITSMTLDVTNEILFTISTIE